MKLPGYPEHEALVAPARNARSGLAWLAAGVVVVIFVVYMATVFYYDLTMPWVGRDALMAGDTAGAMLVLLGSFAIWIFAIALVLPMIHQREFMPSIGAAALPQLRAVVTALIVLHLALLILPPWDAFADTVPGLPLGRWAMLLPLSILAVLVQVSAEEILFRGYLQQQLAARFDSPILWMGVPSALFGLLHYDASAGENAWLLVLWAGMFGLLMADLTARTGSLGPAIAVHLVNNLLAMLVVAPADSLSGLALYQYTFSLSDTEAVRALLPVDFALMWVCWLTARLTLRV